MKRYSLIKTHIVTILLAASILTGAGSRSALGQQQYFKIKVIDGATGRGVPLVELRTTNDARWYTDSSGIVAFDDVDLMGRKVFFTITSHGYSYKKDGFGYTGTALEVKPGGSAVLSLQRQNIAERLYRITGEGIYRDSIIVGEQAPTHSPLFNGQVMGQDTVEVTPYNGKLYWFWGDTSRSDYPLGNFHTSGATSLLPTAGGLNPDKGIDLTYFTDPAGFCKAMLPSKESSPVWVGGLCTVADNQGKERLLCNFARMKSLGEVLERGLAVFDDNSEQFAPFSSLDLKDPVCPLGHPFHADVQGSNFVYSAISDSDPVPGVRVKSDLKHVTDSASYECYTCLMAHSRYAGANSKLDRGADGTLHYGWKAATGPIGWKQEQELIHAGKLKSEECLIQMRDVDTGMQIHPAGGSVYWNSYLSKWVMIFGQLSGSSSLLGEIWYSVADTPTGPWVYARKIVTHNNYTFYNPTQDPFFDSQGGKRIYFEGTYTKTFSDNKDPTPRYEYNQIMYGLSLDDPRLALPAPVYLVKSSTGNKLYELAGSAPDSMRHANIQGIPFFAVPVAILQPGLIPIYEIATPTGTRLVTHATDNGKPLTPMFYAEAGAATTQKPAATTALYEYRRPDGTWLYNTDPNLKQTGLSQNPDPICMVWPNPMKFLPVDWETKAK